MDQDQELLQLFDEIKSALAANPSRSASSSKTEQDECQQDDSSALNLFLPNFFASNKIHPIEENAEKDELPSMDLTIESDIKDLGVELRKSYELFTTVRDTLAEMSFEMLLHRIKDLHLYPDDKEIQKVVKDRPMKECLNDLTDMMKSRLSEHPGEFGDIPEVLTFIQVCSKLKHGMKCLKNQTDQLENIDKRITKSLSDFDMRIDEMQQELQDM